MDIRVQTSQRMEQGLLLIPKMLQSIEVLQLGVADLAGVIEAELSSNETLEVRVPSEETAPPPAQSSKGDEEEWVSPRLARAGSDSSDRKQDFLASLPAGAESLVTYVREQLAWWDLAEEVRDAVLLLVEQLDGRGFLCCEDEELAAIVGEARLDEALLVLRSLDPRGIGARNAIDALLMQVSREDPDYLDIASLLGEHLEALARNKIPDVARRLGRTVAEVQALVERIRELDPHPGSAFSDEVVEHVRPDVHVRLDAGNIEIAVQDASLPSLGINEDYAEMARAVETSSEVKQYLRPKIESARDLIHAIDQRQKTLGRVAGAVMEYQKQFLLRGQSAMRPLKMSEIADVLGMHTSTVSRAVAGKYVQTDRGILPLRSFFDGRRSGVTRRGEADTGRLGIVEKIRELIAGEDPGRPLSDDDLVVLLASNQIDVARRTVAKYRSELGIPSSWRRRRHH